MMWIAAAAAAVGLVIVAHDIWRWRLRRSWDHHAESALRLAQQRHPSNRGVCSCGRTLLQPGHTRLTHDGESMMHATAVCLPTRELL